MSVVKLIKRKPWNWQGNIDKTVNLKKKLVGGNFAAMLSNVANFVARTFLII